MVKSIVHDLMCKASPCVALTSAAAVFEGLSGVKKFIPMTYVLGASVITDAGIDAGIDLAAQKLKLAKTSPILKTTKEVAKVAAVLLSCTIFAAPVAPTITTYAVSRFSSEVLQERIFNAFVFWYEQEQKTPVQSVQKQPHQFTTSKPIIPDVRLTISTEKI